MLMLAATATHAQDKAGTMARIKARFAAINANRALSTTVLDNEEFIEGSTDRGAGLTGYFDGNELVKIVEWVGVSAWNYVTEYYFEKGQLIFVYEETQAIAYDEKKGELDYTKTTRQREGRYYFKTGSLIKSQETAASLNHADGFNPQKEFPATALKYQALLRSKHK